jgi:hypothetical protein
MTTTTAKAKKVRVAGVTIPSANGDLRYHPQSYLVLDGAAHEVVSVATVGHSSQRDAAVRGGHLVIDSSDVDVRIRPVAEGRSRIVAYLPGSNVEVGYAEMLTR